MASTLTQQMWDALPQYVRDADVDQGLPLLAYLSGVGDTLDPDAAVIRAGGDLGDPALVPWPWLGWLAALAGIDTSLYTDAQLRTALADTRTLRRGSLDAITAAITRIVPGADEILAHVWGDWHVDVDVYVSPAPSADDQAAVAAVVAAEIPAWLILASIEYHTTGHSLDWLGTQYATVDDVGASAATLDEIGT